MFCDTISVQVDTATDNHNDNAIFTEDDEKIVNIVAELLGIDAENLKQVQVIVNCGEPATYCVLTSGGSGQTDKYQWQCHGDSFEATRSPREQVISFIRKLANKALLG